MRTTHAYSILKIVKNHKHQEFSFTLILHLLSAQSLFAICHLLDKYLSKISSKKSQFFFVIFDSTLTLIYFKFNHQRFVNFTNAILGWNWKCVDNIILRVKHYQQLLHIEPVECALYRHNFPLFVFLNELFESPGGPTFTINFS